MFYRKKHITKTLCDMDISEGGIVRRLSGDETTLRELRDLGIVVDAPISRVRETADVGSPAVCLQVGERRVGLSDLQAGSVEVKVPRVLSNTHPEVVPEYWRCRYLMNAR